MSIKTNHILLLFTAIIAIGFITCDRQLPNPRPNPIPQPNPTNPSTFNRVATAYKEATTELKTASQEAKNAVNALDTKVKDSKATVADIKPLAEDALTKAETVVTAAEKVMEAEQKLESELTPASSSVTPFVVLQPSKLKDFAEAIKQIVKNVVTQIDKVSDKTDPIPPKIKTIVAESKKAVESVHKVATKTEKIAEAVEEAAKEDGATVASVNAKKTIESKNAKNEIEKEAEKTNKASYTVEAIIRNKGTIILAKKSDNTSAYDLKGSGLSYTLSLPANYTLFNTKGYEIAITGEGGTVSIDKTEAAGATNAQVTAEFSTGTGILTIKPQAYETSKTKRIVLIKRAEQANVRRAADDVTLTLNVMPDKVREAIIAIVGTGTSAAESIKNMPEQTTSFTMSMTRAEANAFTQSNKSGKKIVLVNNTSEDTGALSVTKVTKDGLDFNKDTNFEYDTSTNSGKTLQITRKGNDPLGAGKYVFTLQKAKVERKYKQATVTFTLVVQGNNNALVLGTATMESRSTAGNFVTRNSYDATIKQAIGTGDALEINDKGAGESAIRIARVKAFTIDAFKAIFDVRDGVKDKITITPKDALQDSEAGVYKLEIEKDGIAGAVVFTLTVQATPHVLTLGSSKESGGGSGVISNLQSNSATMKRAARSGIDVLKITDSGYGEGALSITGVTKDKSPLNLNAFKALFTVVEGKDKITITPKNRLQDSKAEVYVLTIKKAKVKTTQDFTLTVEATPDALTLGSFKKSGGSSGVISNLRSDSATMKQAARSGIDVLEITDSGYGEGLLTVTTATKTGKGGFDVTAFKSIFTVVDRVKDKITITPKDKLVDSEAGVYVLTIQKDKVTQTATFTLTVQATPHVLTLGSSKKAGGSTLDAITLPPAGSDPTMKQSAKPNVDVLEITDNGYGDGVLTITKVNSLGTKNRFNLQEFKRIFTVGDGLKDKITITPKDKLVDGEAGFYMLTIKKEKVEATQQFNFEVKPTSHRLTLTQSTKGSGSNAENFGVSFTANAATMKTGARVNNDVLEINENGYGDGTISVQSVAKNGVPTFNIDKFKEIFIVGDGNRDKITITPKTDPLGNTDVGVYRLTIKKVGVTQTATFTLTIEQQASRLTLTQSTKGGGSNAENFGSSFTANGATMKTGARVNNDVLEINENGHGDGAISVESVAKDADDAFGLSNFEAIFTVGDGSPDKITITPKTDNLKIPDVGVYRLTIKKVGVTPRATFTLTIEQATKLTLVASTKTSSSEAGNFGSSFTANGATMKTGARVNNDVLEIKENGHGNGAISVESVAKDGSTSFGLSDFEAIFTVVDGNADKITITPKTNPLGNADVGVYKLTIKKVGVTQTATFTLTIDRSIITGSSSKAAATPGVFSNLRATRASMKDTAVPNKDVLNINTVPRSDAYLRSVTKQGTPIRDFDIYDFKRIFSVKRIFNVKGRKNLITITPQNQITDNSAAGIYTLTIGAPFGYSPQLFILEVIRSPKLVLTRSTKKTGSNAQNFGNVRSFKKDAATMKTGARVNNDVLEINENGYGDGTISVQSVAKDADDAFGLSDFEAIFTVVDGNRDKITITPKTDNLKIRDVGVYRLTIKKVGVTPTATFTLTIEQATKLTLVASTKTSSSEAGNFGSSFTANGATMKTGARVGYDVLEINENGHGNGAISVESVAKDGSTSFGLSDFEAIFTVVDGNRDKITITPKTDPLGNADVGVYRLTIQKVGVTPTATFTLTIDKSIITGSSSKVGATLGVFSNLKSTSASMKDTAVPSTDVLILSTVAGVGVHLSTVTKQGINPSIFDLNEFEKIFDVGIIRDRGGKGRDEITITPKKQLTDDKVGIYTLTIVASHTHSSAQLFILEVTRSPKPKLVLTRSTKKIGSNAKNFGIPRSFKKNAAVMRIGAIPNTDILEINASGHGDGAISIHSVTKNKGKGKNKSFDLTEFKKIFTVVDGRTKNKITITPKTDNLGIADVGMYKLTIKKSGVTPEAIFTLHVRRQPNTMAVSTLSKITGGGLTSPLTGNPIFSDNRKRAINIPSDDWLADQQFKIVTRSVQGNGVFKCKSSSVAVATAQKSSNSNACIVTIKKAGNANIEIKQEAGDTYSQKTLRVTLSIASK